MIVSERVDKGQKEFERLLADSQQAIESVARNNPEYFLGRSAIDFEVDVFDSLCQSAKGTDFDKTIHLVSGYKFPDIVVNRFYGVEVKTTRQGHWKSTGNSVLESTRVENVERIYICFAKLSDPVGFKYRLYQDCLYDIAVTHSPRYLIDMELNRGDSIFDKIGISYDELRKRDNPVRPFIEYYRSISKRGEEPWWLEGKGMPEMVLKPTVSLWSYLSTEEQVSLRNEAMALFPEILGKGRTKYQRVAAWLVAKYGVVDASLRDRFSAGGKVDLEVGGCLYRELPRVFLHFKENARDIVEVVKKLASDEARHYWDLSFLPAEEDKMLAWVKALIFYSNQQVKDSQQIIDQILTEVLPKKDYPPEIREKLADK